VKNVRPDIVKYLTEIFYIITIGVTALRILHGFNEPNWETNILIMVLAIDALNWARFKRYLRSDSPNLTEKAAKTIVKIMK